MKNRCSCFVWLLGDGMCTLDRFYIYNWSHMRIYHTEKILIVLLFLAVTSLSQTADDDEVDTSIPGYPYKIYSGTYHHMQALSSSASQPGERPSTMSSSPRRMTPLMSPSFFGSVEHRAARLFSHVSIRMVPSSSSLENLPSPWTKTPGIKKQASCI